MLTHQEGKKLSVDYLNIGLSQPSYQQRELKIIMVLQIINKTCYFGQILSAHQKLKFFFDYLDYNIIISWSRTD